MPDPVQGLDRYAYVNNSPVRYTDPTGHEVCDEFGYCYDQTGKHRARIRYGYDNPFNWKRSTQNDLDAIEAIVHSGDMVVYRWGEQIYGAVFVNIDAKNSDNWILWDFRLREEVLYSSIKHLVVGFYEFMPDHSYKLREGIGAWKNLPSVLYPNPTDYYGKNKMLVVRGIPTGTNCNWWCAFDGAFAIGGIYFGFTAVTLKQFLVGLAMDLVGVGDFATGFEVYHKDVFSIEEYHK